MSLAYCLSILILARTIVVVHADAVFNVYASERICHDEGSQILTTVDRSIVAFSVGRSAEFSTSKTAIIPMDRVFYNDGGYFDMKTSTFTAPVSGVYAFYFGACGKSGHRIYLQLYVANHLVASTYNYNTASYNHASGSVYKKMKKDDKAWVMLYAGMTIYADLAPNAHFNGHLIKKVA